MARRVLRALLCWGGARAAAAVLVGGGGLRGRGPALPWEDGAASASSSARLTAEEERQVDEYRELKRRQLMSYISTGTMPLPMPGEERKKELWERKLREADSPLDRKLVDFVDEQADKTGMIEGAQVHHEEKPKQKKGKFRLELPVPHSNGTRYVNLGGMNFRTMKFYHMHIPRTGGTSFKQDAYKTTVNNGTLTLFSKEGCWAWKNRFPYVDAVVTFVRNPRSHVLSQFLYCTQGQIKGLTQVRKFRPWIEDWTKIKNKGTFVGDFGSRGHSDKQLFFQKYLTSSFLPFHCYSPWNLMVQHFSCRGTPFNYTNQSVEAKTEIAIQNMKETYFVGITEAYQESLCLFHVKVHDTLPGFCDCKNGTSWRSFNSTHMGFYLLPVRDKPKVSDWRPETTELVDNLTRGDWALYQASLNRFARELHAVEQRFNTTIMCDDKLLSQSRMEDPAQRDFSLYMRQARASLKARP